MRVSQQLARAVVDSAMDDLEIFSMLKAWENADWPPEFA
jgi:hypothetical protein